MRLVTPDQGTATEGGRGGLCAPGMWRGPLRCGPSHSAAAGAPDKAVPAPRGFCREHCLRPRWLDPAGVTLHSHRGPFLPQTEDPEGFLPSPSSCFLPGTLVLDTGSQEQHHVGPRCAHTCTYSHMHTYSHTHACGPTRSRAAASWMLRPGLVCACLGECVCRIQWGVHTCMCVWVSLGELVWGAQSLPNLILRAGGAASPPE